MKTILTLSIAVSLALSGCATTGTMGSFGKPTTNKAPVSAEQKAEARQGAVRAGLKGCGVGAATTVGMSLLGKVLGFGGGVNLGQVAAGCIVSGTAVGVQAYQQQLADFRALQGTVRVGAIVRVDEKTVEVEGKSTKAASGLTMDLDAVKVAAHHRDIQVVVSELAKTLNKQTMPISVQVIGSKADRDWLGQQLAAQLTNKQVSVKAVDGPAPVLTVSPMPEVK
jgi:hypothetical protein